MNIKLKKSYMQLHHLFTGYQIYIQKKHLKNQPSLYSKLKLGEDIVMNWGKIYNLNVTSLRFYHFMVRDLFNKFLLVHYLDLLSKFIGKFTIVQVENKKEILYDKYYLKH